MAEMPNPKQNNFRVLIADDDVAVNRRLVEFLTERGFAIDHVQDGRMVRDVIMGWKPHFVLADLTLPEMNATQLLTWARETDFKDGYKPKILVTSAHNNIQNIKDCIRLGALDFIIKPFKFDDLMTRLVFHIQNKRDFGASDKKSDQLESGDIYLHLLDMVLREALSDHQRDEVLYNFTKMIAITLKAVRCSVVMISEDLQSGTVQASSDNRSMKGFQLDMNKYPEMLHVMNTEKTVVIEDLAYDPMLAKIKDLVKGIQFNSMIVCPVRRDGQMYGIISARMDTTHSKFNDRNIRFVQLVAQIASLVLATNLALPHEMQEPPKVA